jgi:D-threonate/D-erythronate kinase
MPASQDQTRYHPQSARPLAAPSVLVADDLTGACDAAVAFTSACDRIRVQITGPPTDPAGLRVITTESRDLPPFEAELRLRNLIEQLPHNAQLFKKIDSVFRGNTVNEIATVLRHAHFDLAILAPAYPALGRTVHAGVLHIQDAAGTRTVPIGDHLRQAGCLLAALPADQSTESFPASLRHHIDRRRSAFLCDASTQLDLLRIVRAVRSLNKHSLWIGSGGLAHALAADLPPQPAKPHTYMRPGAAILFIGSPHPVSRAQLHHLRQIANIHEHGPGGTHRSADDLLVSVELGKTTPDEIRVAVASHATAQISYLFMTGGATAHYVCRALDIRSLRLQHEFVPGVPVAVAEGGPFDGVRVVLKSGGFGEPDLLCRLLEAHRSAPEVIA